MELFACGHANYGTAENPASVRVSCSVCEQYYCDQCNYDTHVCQGCGEHMPHDRTTINHKCWDD